jgi:hypothetical protein
MAAGRTDRNALIAAHLDRLEAELSQARAAVESLRDLLQAELAIISHHDCMADAERRTDLGWPIFRADTSA